MVDYKLDIDKDHFQEMINPLYFGNSPLGFFNGATNKDSNGIGLVVKLTSSHSFKAYMAIGHGSNIIAELIDFWGVLF